MKLTTSSRGKLTTNFAGEDFLKVHALLGGYTNIDITVYLLSIPDY